MKRRLTGGCKAAPSTQRRVKVISDFRRWRERMKNQTKLMPGLIAIMLIAILALSPVVSQAQSRSNSFEPLVTATYPADDATDVLLNQPISVTFSRKLSVGSIGSSIILQGSDGSQVEGKV